jgi:replicative superfamily II helicase
LVLASTAAGKTGIGWTALTRALIRGQVGVMLVPTRALAEEVYHRLARAWSGWEICGRRVRVALSTGEQSARDGAIRQGRVDVVVAVYEKFRALSAQAPMFTARIGCVVFDEIHLVADPQRGPGADLLLTSWLARSGAVQVVGLGGAVEDAHLLSQWMGTEALVWRGRPMDLREGTLCMQDGWFCYRGRDGASDHHGLERMLDPAVLPQSSADESHGALKALCRLSRRLLDRQENLLVFVPTRRLAREWACYLAASLGESRAYCEMKPEGDVLLPASYARIEAAEEGHGRRLLLECARVGVGFHSGDLSPALRSPVEEAFAAGQLRILLATPTLAEGVNLGCQNVLVVPAELVGGESWNQGAAVLDRRRLANMGGRAGRDPLDSNPARAMVLVRDRDHSSQVWQNLLGPGATTQPAEDCEALLELMVLGKLGLAHEPMLPSQLALRLLETFVGTVRWQNHGSQFFERVNRVLDRLEEWGLVTCGWADEQETNEEAQVSLTAAGRLAATHGLTPASAIWLATVLPQWPQHESSTAELPLLLAAAHCLPSSENLLPTPAVAGPRATAVHQTLAADLPFVLPGLESAWELDRPLPAEELAAGLRALLARDWLAGEPIPVLESRYRVFSGAMATLGTQIAHVLQAISLYTATIPGCCFPREQAQSLARRLPLGLTVQAEALAPLSIIGLSRTEAILLAREGFDSLASLGAAQSGVLEGILGAGMAARVLETAPMLVASSHALPPEETAFVGPAVHDPQGISHRLVRAGESTQRRHHRSNPGFGQSPIPSPVTTTSVDLPSPEGCLLALDAAQPGQTRILGQMVSLSPLAWQLLLLLARRTGRVTAYTVIRQVLWPGLRVGDQQVRFHKRRLVQVLDAVGAKDWIQTRHGHGLLLTLSLDQVSLSPGVEAAVAA